jgi:hypothetical protein
MPFAEGPIDVDRMQDWELANRIVRERELAEAPQKDRHAGLDPASTFFSSRHPQVRWTPDQVRGDGGAVP